MKIESLYIERFGALRDKRLEDFRPDVEVIYAPNESGKTTFIQFVRCMLYGLYAGRAYAGEEQRMSGRLTFSDFSAENPSKRLTISPISPRCTQLGFSNTNVVSIIMLLFLKI